MRKRSMGKFGIEKTNTHWSGAGDSRDQRGPGQHFMDMGRILMQLEAEVQIYLQRKLRGRDQEAASNKYLERQIVVRSKALAPFL